MSLELAARMIFLARRPATLEEARRIAESTWWMARLQEVQAGGGGAGRQPAGAR
jgi:hypothetical protein